MNLTETEQDQFANQLLAEIQNCDLLVDKLADLYQTGGQETIDRFWKSFQELKSFTEDQELVHGLNLIDRRMCAGEGITVAPLEYVYFGEYGPLNRAKLAERKAVETVLEQMGL